MNYREEYNKWLDKADEATTAELANLSDKEIEDRFYRDLEFGTGGLRGVIGAGTNRMNKYIIARATKGLANYISSQCDDSADASVVIAYDSRNYSDVFARCAAEVLSDAGIQVYLFDSLRPTPMLSFAVRHLGATAGIVVTASHNPAKYNGYKVYWSDGGQVPPEVASAILTEINNLDVFDVVYTANDERITIIGEEVDNAYLDNVYAQSVNPDVDKSNFKLVYTPLHGSGNLPVRAILAKSGFDNVLIVKEQELPDGDFPTVASPNPENKECFESAIALAKENDVDLIIGTDPDCDRMGIVVRNKEGDYVTMTGNQVGVLLLNYILSSKKPPENGAVVSTIVSTPMGRVVAEHYGMTYFATLTGFKFIGEKIYEFEKSGKHTFMFGYEESYGYLKGTYARDKDGVVAAMLTAEMGAYYAKEGKTLYDVMESLYEKFGAYYEELQNLSFEGVEGAAKMQSVMKNFRTGGIANIGDAKVLKVTDYLGDTDLPKSDVLYFSLDNGVDFVIRPSGTEPKVKIYYLAKADTYPEAVAKTKYVKGCIDRELDKM